MHALLWLWVVSGQINGYNGQGSQSVCCVTTDSIASSPEKYHIMLPLMSTATAFDTLRPDDRCWLDTPLHHTPCQSVT